MSFNSLTVEIVQSIAQNFHQTIEVSAIEPTINRCTICTTASNNSVAVFCSTVEEFTNLITINITSQKSLHNPADQFDIFESATVQHDLHIMGMDFHFDMPFSLIMTADMSVMINDVCHLVTTTHHRKNLQYMLVVFLICSMSDSGMNGMLDFFISYFPDWRVFTSCISCATFGDPVAAYHLLAWGAH